MGVNLQSLRKFDAFPRAEDHLLQKTCSGAVVSVIGLSIIATLFVHELKYYLTTYTVHEVVAARVRDEEPQKKDKERSRAVVLNVEDSDSTSSSDLEEKIGAEGFAMLLRQDDAIQCYGCMKFSHVKSDCPDHVDEKPLETNRGHRDDKRNHKDKKDRKLKKKALWAFSDSESSSSSAEEQVNFCLMGRSRTSSDESANEDLNEMSVDLKRGETLPIHINMTFPSLPCSVLSVDAVDLSGKHEVDLDTNIWKLHIDSKGQTLGTSEYLTDLVEKEHSPKEHVGGKDHDENSFHKKHENDISFGSDAEKMIKKVKEAMEKGEGCRVYGFLDVQRVAGNFHISVHGLNILVAQQIFGGPANINISHIIHDLSFGPKYPGIQNPLDGTIRILHSASGSFKYYIKVVPTEYRYLNKVVLPTNQFSVAEYFVPLKDAERSWPAVYFIYDLSPITVAIKEERRSFLHLITRLCAVLGGTFALTGMLDRWMYRLVGSFNKSKTGPSFLQ